MSSTLKDLCRGCTREGCQLTEIPPAQDIDLCVTCRHRQACATNGAQTCPRIQELDEFAPALAVEEADPCQACPQRDRCPTGGAQFCERFAEDLEDLTRGTL